MSQDPSPQPHRNLSSNLKLTRTQDRWEEKGFNPAASGLPPRWELLVSLDYFDVWKCKGGPIDVTQLFDEEGAKMSS